MFSYCLLGSKMYEYYHDDDEDDDNHDNHDEDLLWLTLQKSDTQDS